MGLIAALVKLGVSGFVLFLERVDTMSFPLYTDVVLLARPLLRCPATGSTGATATTAARCELTWVPRTTVPGERRRESWGERRTESALFRVFE